jgi:hypothetical protein
VRKIRTTSEGDKRNNKHILRTPEAVMIAPPLIVHPSSVYVPAPPNVCEATVTPLPIVTLELAAAVSTPPPVSVRPVPVMLRAVPAATEAVIA